ncbi:MAG: DUF87 domain-containing protein [Planctomycetota bacterium]
MQDFEKLGVFYLGREHDLDRGVAKEELVLYDAKDLTTHALCVGMTGSGKTGLCLGLLEEAAIDGIPALVIDPKGDLANLLLAFPALSPADFLPWIDADAARRASLTPEAFAAAEAAKWKEGLARSGQDGARIQRLKDAADVVVYTPGSTAGLPVSILSSLQAPAPEVRDDGELFQERIASTVTGLLGLLGVDADPIQSREHILLSTIVARAWSEERDLDLAALIHAIQEPPVAKIGVLDVEAFFPAKERFQLAMRLNNLLASPSFASWLEGEPLDVGRALYTEDGKPRVAIYSIAHLSDAERMFFVSLLLNQTLGWVRRQTGTSSLRALLYMDEIAGYFPPVANPPSKAPLLTLLKQARAFGLGVVLATQNPVDLDYKGLANCGTWFLGRLQTERDKLRVLDGLEGAAQGAGDAAFDRATMDQTLSRLGKRVFLMNNVHESRPVVFETRWTLSYLRGPMTRTEVKRWMDPLRAKANGAGVANGGAPVSGAASGSATSGAAASVAVSSGARSGAASAVPTASAPSANSPTPSRTAESAAGGPSGSSTRSPAVEATNAARKSAPDAASTRPLVAPEVRQLFLPVRKPAPAGATLAYAPALFASGRVYFTDAKLGVDVATTPRVLVALGSGPVAVDWDGARAIELDERDLDAEPRPGARFDDLPPEAGKPKSYDGWKRSVTDWLYRTQELALLRAKELGLTSRPGESERDFQIRVRDAAREERDAEAQKLRAKYAPKLAALDERVRRAQQAVQREAEQARESKVSSFLSFGVTLLGAFAGRKTFSAANAGRAATTARTVGRSMKESKDVERAEETVEALQAQLAALDAQFQEELRALDASLAVGAGAFEPLALKAKKTNVSVQLLALAWTPVWRAADGAATPAWE